MASTVCSRRHIGSDFGNSESDFDSNSNDDDDDNVDGSDYSDSESLRNFEIMDRNKSIF